MTLLLAPDGASQSAQAQDKFPLVPAAQFRPRGGIGNVLTKLNAGKDVKIAYFGGSITAANGWRPKSLEWFQQNVAERENQRNQRGHRRHRQRFGCLSQSQDVLQYQARFGVCRICRQ